MLEDMFKEVYTKFKLHFYRGIFERLHERNSSLSAAESYAVEVIHALNNPTISQFAAFLQISQPNATYKINALIKKGYIEKIKSSSDKREYFLKTTVKFLNYYAINQNYISVIMQRIHERFTPEETEQLTNMLRIISQELMPESGNEL